MGTTALAILYSGTIGIGAVTSANSVGVAGACSGGSDGTAYSVSLTTTAANSLRYGAVALRGRTHTPGSGFGERADFRQGASSGDMAGVATEDVVAPTASAGPVNGTLSGTSDYAVIAVEVKGAP